MASSEKRLFKHGGSWAVDLPIQFAREVKDMSVVIDTSPGEVRITPKTDLDTMESDPLFQQFIEAIAADAVSNPDRLHAVEEVWDDEWDSLLKGVESDGQ